MRTIGWMSFVWLLAAAASSLYAVTYIVPTDHDLVLRSDAIVIATATGSHSEITNDGRIVTIATLVLDEVLKGDFVSRTSIDLTEPGGFVGDRGAIIPGSPRYAEGKHYLVFLRRTSDGWATYGFGLGQFEYVSDSFGHSMVTRGGMVEGIFGWDEIGNAPHVEGPRDAAAFQTFIKTVVANPGAPARSGYFLKTGEAERSSSYSPKPAASAPGGLDGVGAMTAATANWSGAAAGVSYGVGTTNTSASGGLTHSDGINAVLFNDPQNFVPSGVAAVGGAWTTGVYSNLGDGFTYATTVEVDVVVGSNFSTNQSTFNILMTHEMGHTLGFRHSDGTSDPLSPQDGHSCQAPSPCASPGQAVMASTVFNLPGLQPWDLDAVRIVYGSQTGKRTDYLLDGNPRWQSPSATFAYCFAPIISGQPASTSIVQGAHATLTVTTTGGSVSPTYQWYVGDSGDISNPIGGATSSSVTVNPTVTTKYWVRLTVCGPQNSTAATVTVTACTAPSAPAPMASPSSIAVGQSSTLTDTPTGSSPFTYQWYIGNSGVTTSPIGGATSSSVMVSPTTTTSYWVRVTGQCTPTADSPATSVIVTPCVPPSAPTPNASPSSIPNGQSSTLSVSPTGSGPFTYQWYVGNPGDTSNPIGGATNSFVTVSPTVTTNYWVRVSGLCAPPSDSPATTVTVTCSPIGPSGVTAQPSSINAGQSSTLFFSTAGSGPFTIQWYIGSQGDTSNPIAGATGTSIIVSPTVTTGYWVHVVAGCGSADGSTIVFVTGTPCVAPSITTQPASSTINAGSPVTLTVAANGTAPFTYQWYIGNSGDVSHPVAGATSTSLTQSPSVTTKYWVRVSNSCNGTQSADSNAATITIGCTSPSITTQPANVSVVIGAAATLHVVAAGTGLHYAWFQGAKGDTSKPTGSVDSPNFVSRAISGNTSFWVRVTGTCGSVDSNAAAVSVTAAPRRRSARH